MFFDYSPKNGAPDLQSPWQELAGLYTDLKALAAKHGLTDYEMEKVLESILG